MTWGKVDPDRLPDAVVCYTDSTIALPLLTAYALARREPRPLKRLYDRREATCTSSSATPTRAGRQRTADRHRRPREAEGARARSPRPARDPSYPDTVDRAR